MRRSLQTEYLPCICEALNLFPRLLAPRHCNKGQTEELFVLKKTKEMEKLNDTEEPEFDSFAINDIIGKFKGMHFGKITIEYEDCEGSEVSVLTCWIQCYIM